jgi:acyl-CoA oxidase
LNHKVKELLREVRVDAIPLVDAFDFSDRTLNNSTLGRFDGHVYDALYESAQREPLNASAIPEGYKYISALLKKKAKL